MRIAQRITPCLWFNFNAEEAVAFYLGVFPNSRIIHTSRYGPESPEHEGKVLMIEFELDGQPFQALNGGPMYRFNEAISLSVDCADQAEVDRVWAALTADGANPCNAAGSPTNSGFHGRWCHVCGGTSCIRPTRPAFNGPSLPCSGCKRWMWRRLKKRLPDRCDRQPGFARAGRTPPPLSIC